MALAGLRLSDAGPVVVSLEPLAAPALPPEPGTALIRQHGAHFEPAFLVVSVGQPVQMPNEDTIYHNVFSYSRPNAFDLGLYPAGQSRTVRFDAPGLVRIYCSIHEEMNGLIYVAPGPLFARPGAGGGFRIQEIPAGRYQLHVFSERLPEVAFPISFSSGERAEREIQIGAASLEAASAR